MKTAITQFIVDELLSGLSIGEQDDLLLSGLVDSIGIMRLIAFIEQEAGVVVPPEDVTIENFVNISAIDAYVSSLKPA